VLSLLNTPIEEEDRYGEVLAITSRDSAGLESNSDVVDEVTSPGFSSVIF
jgi:hypothetical protein